MDATSAVRFLSGYSFFLQPEPFPSTGYHCSTSQVGHRRAITVERVHFIKLWQSNTIACRRATYIMAWFEGQVHFLFYCTPSHASADT